MGTAPKVDPNAAVVPPTPAPKPLPAEVTLTDLQLSDLFFNYQTEADVLMDDAISFCNIIGVDPNVYAEAFVADYQDRL